MKAHKKEFGSSISKGGHPDNGLGRFSDKLDFITWIKLQNAQRVHLNYLEGLPSYLMNLLIAGLFYPKPASALGVIHLLGRELYGRGYRKNGPGGRLKGYMLVSLSSLTLMVLTIFGGLALTGLL